MADVHLRKEQLTAATASKPLLRPLELRRASLFFDFPLAQRLAGSAVSELSMPGATCYFDHNAGWEPLPRVQEPWTWWQRHGAPGEPWEVGYWFPRLGKGYFGSSESEFAIVTANQQPFRMQVSRTLFGVPLAQNLTSFSGATYKFSRRLESAPFYARSECVHSRTTIESLLPARLTTATCQTMLDARRLRIQHTGGQHQSAATRDQSALFETLNRSVTSNNGRSFFLASHVIARGDRYRAYFVYALCRIIDDATDMPISKGEDSRAAAALLDAIFAPDVQRELQSPALLQFLAQRLSHATARHLSLSDASAYLTCARTEARKMGLERRLFEALLQGQRMDEAFVRPRNFDELYLYCFRVAGVVGLMMASVFRASCAPATQLAAEHLGIAMQITNICRDVREDAARGRIYVPIAPGHAAESLPDAGEISSLGYTAVRYYRSALSGLSGIPGRRSRICVRLMTAVYGAILGDILQQPATPLFRRVVVSRPRRIWLATLVLCGRDPLAAAKVSHWETLPT